MSEDRLNIAVIVKNFNLFGGMERYAVEVAQRLAEKGHQVDIYARGVDRSLLGAMKFFPLSNYCSFSSVLSAVELAINVNKIINRQNYDIVHSHERAYCQDLLTIHCFSYKGSLEKCSGLNRIDQKYFSPRSWLYLWLESKQMRTEDLASVSGAVKNDLFKYYNRTKNVTVIPPGVDSDYYSSDWVKENRQKVRDELCLGSKNTILFMGSEFKRKGLDHVIPAISKNMRLLVVGQGDNINYYKKMAKKYGASEQVNFVGHSDDPRKYYGAADLVVLPSNSEAFGMTILEGMACGLPVVATANSGVSDIIKHEVNGYVLDSGKDIQQFIKEFFNKQSMNEVGRQAQKTANLYNWQKVTDKYEKLFYKIVEAKEENV